MSNLGVGQTELQIYDFSKIYCDRADSYPLFHVDLKIKIFMN